MTEIEKKLLATNDLFSKNSKFDYKMHYSDEFYEEYLSSFVMNKRKKYIYRFVKRLFDIVLSLISIVLLFPIWIVFPIWIKIESKGPVIFKNRRVGRINKIFNCFKFRSMRTDAPKEQATSIFSDASKYITSSGKFMRKTSIDELPQLFNVLSGKMSIIGYRPLVPTEVNCNNMREQLGVFRMKPGISGYAQVIGRDDVYYKNKAIIDAYYVNKASIWLDVKILFMSIGVVFLRKGNSDSYAK